MQVNRYEVLRRNNTSLQLQIFWDIYILGFFLQLYVNIKFCNQLLV